MPRRILPILLAALLAAACIPHLADAQTAPSAEPAAQLAELAEVKETLFRLYDALSTHDGEAYAALCTPDYRLVEGGEIWDLDRELALLAEGGGPGWSRENRYDFLHTRVDRDQAVLVYQLESDVTTQGRQLRLRWLESATLTRDESGWRVALLHSTRLP